MHYGISDDSVETLSIFVFVTECYSESEQEDPEIAAETAPPPCAEESLLPLVCTDVLSVLVINQMHGQHSSQLGRNHLDC